MRLLQYPHEHMLYSLVCQLNGSEVPHAVLLIERN